MADLERDFDYKEEHFDFIQKFVRKFCLQFGASLFYTSVKEDKNCDLLYKFLVYRIYDFPFKTPALVVEKDAVFMWDFYWKTVPLNQYWLSLFFYYFSPAGWDNEKKIAILHENMHSVKPDQVIQIHDLRGQMMWAESLALATFEYGYPTIQFLVLYRCDRKTDCSPGS